MEYALSELFTLQMGKTPSRDNSSYWGKSENSWISIADLTNSGKYISNTKETLSDSAVAESGIKKIPANTVIMSFKLSLGKVAITEKEMYSNEAIMAFIDKGVEKISPEYLYYLLRAKDWSKGTNKAVMGATLNKATLSTIKIQLHEYDNQLEIVNMLNRVSSSIDFRKQQLTKLDELIKARFVEMFGDPIANSVGWEEVQLSGCLESIDNGKSYVCDTSCRKGESPAILKLSAVTYGDYRPDENKAMLDEAYFSKDITVQSGDLLFTRKNTPELVGMCAYVYKTPANLMLPDLIFRLNTKPLCNKIYLWKLINHELFRKQIQALSSGSAKSMSNISKERLLHLSVILPPLSLQNQFAAFVAEVDKSKVEVQKALDQTQLLFDSLMQQYFG